MGDYLGIGDLQPVYVELKLQCEALATSSGSSPSGGELEGLRPLIDRALNGRLAPGRRWLLRGDPGSGKSILLRWLAAELAREAGARLGSSPAANFPDEPRLLIPIFFSLPQLMQELEEPLDRIESTFRRFFPRSEVAGLKDALERAGEDGRLVVLLDGLDEVPAAERHDAAELAAGLAQRWERSVVILSSRRISLPHPTGFQIIDILPLDRNRRLELLAEWLGKGVGRADTSRAEHVLQQLSSEPGLWGLTDNPLYLTLIALLIKRGGNEGGVTEALAAGGHTDFPAAVRHRYQLYDQVFQLLLEGRHRDQRQPMPNQIAVRSSLRFFACALTEKDLHSVRVQELEEILLEDAAEPVWRALQQHRPWKNLPREYLDEMATKTGILAPYEGEDWRFQHRAFREALIAESLGKPLSALLAGGREASVDTDAAAHAAGWETFMKEVQRRADAGDRWAEPYALCIEASADPDLVVRRIISVDRTFGLRALSGVHGLQPATLQEILALTDDWQRRRDVILRLIDLAGEPASGIRLLKMVLGTTSNGNDLFFIEQALAEAGRQWPDLEDLVQGALDAIFSHCPSPDPTLFLAVETGEGKVPLWREMPAGSFMMGDDEAGPEEGPAHEVIFTAPFRLSAIPVTRRQYAAFDPRHDPADWLPGLPVVRVTWYAAQAFCRWLAKSGTAWTGARLPTEEEWEYACAVSGSQGPWWCGEKELQEVAWFRDNAEGRCHAVATRRASPLGLYDLHGNVHEWCLNRWQPDHSSASTAPGGLARPTEPALPVAPRAPLPEDELNAARPLRGGCYQDPAERLRRTARKAAQPWKESDSIGFRIMLPGGTSSLDEDQER